MAQPTARSGSSSPSAPLAPTREVTTVPIHEITVESADVTASIIPFSPFVLFYIYDLPKHSVNQIYKYHHKNNCYSYRAVDIILFVIVRSSIADKLRKQLIHYLILTTYFIKAQADRRAANASNSHQNDKNRPLCTNLETVLYRNVSTTYPPFSNTSLAKARLLLNSKR